MIETSWADWVASGKPDANPLKMILQRRIRPRGKHPRDRADAQGLPLDAG